MFENQKNLVEIFYNSYNRYPDKIYLQFKKKDDTNFSGFTFNQCRDMIESLAASLYQIGVNKGKKVGIISDNRYQWLIADMAVLSLRAADVPRGSDTVAKEISYILDHSESEYCFVENPEQADKILSEISNIKRLKTIILMTGEENEVKTNIPSNVNILTFEKLLIDGNKLKSENQEVLKDLRNSIDQNDIATIIYTSGTTGKPKGVILMHKNIMHNVQNLPEVIKIKLNDRWLSILPVWHIFERTIEYVIMSNCNSMAYSKPTANHLLPNLALIKPTFMASVPRVWEAIYNGILKKIKSGSPVKKVMFHSFLGIGKLNKALSNYLFEKNPHFKRQIMVLKVIPKIFVLIFLIILFIPNLLGKILVFSKIKKKTGGCLRVPISGGGALPSHVDKFFAAINIDILEGYGLTETAPVIAVRNSKTKVASTVGQPVPGVEVRICDENGKPLDNQYKKGKIYVKGDLVMSGYYKEPGKTKQVLSDDGWFDTGDLGRFTVTGELQLTGRAKDTIVLIGGENVEPAPIEAKILESSLISQVMICGQDKINLSAIIIPEEENLTEFAKKQKIEFTNYNDLVNNKLVENEIKKIINSKINIHQGFRNFERVYGILLIAEPFEIGKELTQTLKLKRNVIAEKYKEQIESKCY